MMMNPNSATIWLPAIQKAGLRVPKTIMIPYNHSSVACFIDDGSGVEGDWDAVVSGVKKAAHAIGYPVFIRTDLASAKHNGIKAFRATSRDTVGQCLAETIIDNEMKFGFGPGPTHIMVRQWLDLHHTFTAYRGMPVAREWRFFADSRTVFCAHPYWPEGAVENGMPSVDDWRPKLQMLNELPQNYGQLCSIAMHAAAACGGDAWSVDFAMDCDGEWWLIDMARMENSWHWPGCPNGERR